MPKLVRNNSIQYLDSRKLFETTVSKMGIRALHLMSKTMLSNSHKSDGTNGWQVNKLYVDDILIAGKDIHALDSLKQSFMAA